MSRGWEHHFNNLLIFYKQINYNGYQKHTKMKEKYIKKFYLFLNQLAIKQANFITNKFNS
jgi:hypothetical protein